jgi:hypothetical protein
MLEAETWILPVFLRLVTNGNLATVWMTSHYRVTLVPLCDSLSNMD